MKKIVIIHCGKIGDIVNTQPLCRVVKENFPDSEIIFLTWPEGKEIAALLPEIDYVEIVENRAKNVISYIKEIIQIRLKHKIDLAIVVNHSSTYSFLAFLLGAKCRVGRHLKGPSVFLHKKFLINKDNDNVHIIESLLHALKPLNQHTDDYRLDLSDTFNKDDIDYVSYLINQADYSDYKLIGLSPCSAMGSKDWVPGEAKRFIDMVNEIPGYKVVLTGDHVADNFAQKIKELGTNDFLDLTNKTNLKQFAVLINKFHKFISVDTGSAHLAYAYNVPTIVLFFMDIYKKWGPTNLELHQIIYYQDKSILKAEELISKLDLPTPVMNAVSR